MEEKEVKSLIPIDKEKKLSELGAQFVSEFKNTKQIIIGSQQECDNALNVVKRVKTAYDDFEADRKEIVDPLNKDVREVNAKYKPVTSFLEQVEKMFKDALSVWDNEQERIRQEEQAKLDAEAERIRNKASEKAVEELDKADAYRAQGRDDLAAKAEVRASTHDAIASQTVAQIIENETRGKGATFTIEYEATIQDAHAAINALNTDEYRHLITINTGAIGKLAKLKNGHFALSGVLITQKKKVAIYKSR